MKKTEIFFPFEPKPKGRPRFTRMGRAYTPKTTHDYEKQLREYYKENCKDFYNSAIQVKMTFNMPIPKSLTKKQRAQILSGEVKYVKKPDLDNLIKSATDALIGVAFEDDNLITKIIAEKKYTSSTPGTQMEIIEDDD